MNDQRSRKEEVIGKIVGVLGVLLLLGLMVMALLGPGY